MDKSKINYKLKLKKYIIELLSREGAKSYKDVIRKSRGAFPNVVYSVLNSTNEIKKIQKKETFFESNESPVNISKKLMTDNIEGNPLFSTWYFSNESCRNIEKLTDFENKNLCFLGTPHLFEWFRNKGTGNKRTLFEIDKHVLSILKKDLKKNEILHQYNCLKNLKKSHTENYDYIFFDPPWYLEEYKLWLKRALELSPKATIIFPIFGEFTRGSAKEEIEILKSILNNSNSNYFIITELIDYQVPSFEREILKVKNDQELDFIGKWKMADLIILQPSEDLNSYLKLDNWKLRDDIYSWEEYVINDIRIFINDNSSEKKFKNLINQQRTQEGLILESPSYRNDNFSKYNLITSRGHAVWVNNTKIFKKILKKINSTEDFKKLNFEFDKKSKNIIKKIIN